MDLIDLYYKAGQPDKARALADGFEAELLKSSQFFLDFYDYANQDFEYAYQMVQYLAEVYDGAGDTARSEAILSRLDEQLSAVVGHD